MAATPSTWQPSTWERTRSALRRAATGLTVAVVLLPAGRAAADEAAPRSPAVPDTSRAGPTSTPCPAGAARVGPERRIQDVVDRLPAGASICIAAGRHRGQTIAPKSGQHFFGEPGAVLDGMVELGRFVHDGSNWTTLAPVPPVQPRGICRDGAPACDRPERVSIDGAPLTRVLDAANLKAGQFAIDGARRIRLFDDPSGHRVEANGAVYAFLTNGARDVTVANLVVEGYGNPAQRGAVFDDQDPRATGWLVEHNLVRSNSGLGILAGPGARILSNRVENNGQLGISASLDGALIEGNEIAGNNTRGFEGGWEAGGLKAAIATKLSIRANHVHHNHGPGLWCDVRCHETTYDGNLVEFNDGPGIFHEISYAASIRNNTLRQNGLVNPLWYWDANILIAASQDVVVEHNLVTVADGGAGIALVDQGRQDGPDSHFRTTGNRVRDNEVQFTGRRPARMGGASDVAPGTPNDGIIEHGDNLFENNLYLLPVGGEVRFGWGSRDPVSFSQFVALGQEKGSRIVLGGE